MNDPKKIAKTFIMLVLVTHLPTESFGGQTNKQCICIAHKSLCHKPPSSKIGHYATAAACLAPVGLLAGVGYILSPLGFTATGIAGGSVGAWLMSLSGGNVAAGSLVALLQSWGVAGAGYGAYGVAGSMATTCLYALYPSLLNKYSTEPKCESSTAFVCFFNDNYSGHAGYYNRNTAKASLTYPEGKKVTMEELYNTNLHQECDIQRYN